jgi:hypothetical protein
MARGTRQRAGNSSLNEECGIARLFDPTTGTLTRAARQLRGSVRNAG